MLKLVPFMASSHRLWNNSIIRNSTLTEKIRNFAEQNQSKNPQFSSLLSLSLENEKLGLLIKVMVDRDGLGLLYKTEYQNRLVKEFEVILNHQENYLLDFFLIYESVANFYTVKNEIANIGRGSASGSLVNYLLGITKLDPIKHGLLFERWMSKTVIPDLDFDCENNKEVIEFLKGIYGEYCRPVKINHIYKLKITLREVLTNNDVNVDRMNMIIKWVDEIQRFFKGSTELEAFNLACEHDESFKDFFILNPRLKKEVLKLLGTNRGKEGIHAAGIVLSDVSSTFLENIDQMGVPKLDFLSMTAYRIIKESISLETFESLDMNSFVNPNGINRVLLSDKEGSLFSVVRNLFPVVNKKAPVNTLLDLAVLLAKSRPGPLMILDHLSFNEMDDRVDSVLEETKGELIFQEQVMLILHNCLNAPLDECAEIMKGLSRRDPKVLERREEFIQRIGENGSEIFKYLEILSKYTFSKAHALSYSMIDYLLYNSTPAILENSKYR